MTRRRLSPSAVTAVALLAVSSSTCTNRTNRMSMFCHAQPAASASTSSTSCASNNEKAQECGATNPDRPLGCCEGYRCANEGAGGSKVCIAVSDNADNADDADADADIANVRDESNEPTNSSPTTTSTTTTTYQYQPTSPVPPSPVDLNSLSPLDRETYSLLTGCGPFEPQSVSDSGLSLLPYDYPSQYASVMLNMHRDMAIQFTGSDEYDLVAAMIPHHAAAVDMCEVYHYTVRPTSEAKAKMSAGGVSYGPNPGIESLCYNITYGPVDGLGYGARWQRDFSQVGETEQMMDIVQSLGRVGTYEEKCGMLSEEEKRDLALKIDDAIRGGGGGGSSNNEKEKNEDKNKKPHFNDAHPAAAWWDVMEHREMFMGCGDLSLPSTLDYLSSAMKMHMRMAIAWTGDPDIDFLLGMLPHHEGAIEMCDIYYKYWSCAPAREVCVDPLPMDVVLKRMSRHQEVSALNALHHICAGHILATQPKEVEWMKAELGRISPNVLASYEAQVDVRTGEFLLEKLPCAAKYVNVNIGVDVNVDVDDIGQDDEDEDLGYDIDAEHSAEQVSQEEEDDNVISTPSAPDSDFGGELSSSSSVQATESTSESSSSSGALSPAAVLGTAIGALAVTLILIVVAIRHVRRQGAAAVELKSSGKNDLFLDEQESSPAAPALRAGDDYEEPEVCMI